MVGARLHQARVGGRQGTEGTSLNVQDIAIDDALLEAAAGGAFGLGEEELAGVAEGQESGPAAGIRLVRPFRVSAPVVSSRAKPEAPPPELAMEESRSDKALHLFAIELTINAIVLVFNP